MKKVAIALLLSVVSLNPFAHSGRTDSNGCHIDKTSNTEHCHDVQSTQSQNVENPMTATTFDAFDTHEFFKELKGVGFSEQQAEVITRLQKTAIKTTLEQAKNDYHLDELANKRDLKELELELKRDIAESKSELIRWVVGFGLFQTAIITALLLKLSNNV